ncbi:hypothetical protein COEREDRAFT_7955 [Coemansia reversa NRRL 1564]|uniref:Uncharacterized protein n=1 Tax=Coemansia reversa (strain ATCC 12441 / NRRL 1564) TaxID=763665 RepID=A0A2G5BCS0_COERN|nr:hypothetical protein COEREDRAFT_7955 [Coemansia reversa NRRL 1564]|eukprot:PIA16806.1 hypothetical protein COEREDRAFT_7955 [Coemansia reversa NRRL 1564]
MAQVRWKAYAAFGGGTYKNSVYLRPTKRFTMYKDTGVDLAVYIWTKNDPNSLHGLQDMVPGVWAVSLPSCIDRAESSWPSIQVAEFKRPNTVIFVFKRRS